MTIDTNPPFIRDKGTAWLSQDASKAMDQAGKRGWDAVRALAESLTTDTLDRDFMISLWAETRTPSELRSLYDEALAREDLQEMFDIVDLTATCSVAIEEGRGQMDGPFLTAFRGTEITDIDA